MVKAASKIFLDSNTAPKETKYIQQNQTSINQLDKTFKTIN